MATAPNGQSNVLFAREADGTDVGSAEAADDDRWPPVDHRIPYRARLVISRFPGQNHLAAQTCSESVQRGSVDPAPHFRPVGNLEHGHRDPPPNFALSAEDDNQ
jgi:hypothetical protein